MLSCRLVYLPGMYRSQKY